MKQSLKKKYIVSAGKSENQLLSEINVKTEKLTKKIIIQNAYYYDSITTSNIIEVKQSGMTLSNNSNDKLCFLYKHSAGIYKINNIIDIGEMSGNITNIYINFYLFNENGIMLSSNGILFFEILFYD